MFTPLQRCLEAVAARVVLFNELVTISSLYILPLYQLQKYEFHALIYVLSGGYLVLGDFNVT